MVSDNRRDASPTFQGNQYFIKPGYATKIAIGDVVATDSVTNVGYVKLAADGGGANSVLGIFMGVLGYYDNTAQQQMYGLNGSWPGASANAANDVPCLVCDDQDKIFRAQVSGGPYLASWRGKNIDWLHGNGTNGNGSPNASGISTLALDGSTVATTATLPFRIVGVAGIAGGNHDPTYTNPWILVQLNFGISEFQNNTGL